MAVDRQAILAILEATALFTPDQIDAAMRQVDLSLEATGADYTVHVAEENGRVCGYTSYGPTTESESVFDLYWIAVDPAHQHRGIGKRLLESVENDVRAQQGDTLVIETSSSEPYAATRDFYQRNGYTEVSRIKDFYRREHDKVIFCRTLS